MPDWSFLDDGQGDDGTIRIRTSRLTHASPKPGESYRAVQTVASWLFAAAVVGGCWHLVKSIPEQTDADFAATDNRVLAVINAQSHIKTMLLSPRSARWPGALDGIDLRNHATRQRDGTYMVRSWVDADNACGASIRTWYTVHLHVRKDGNSDVIAAQLLE